MATEICSPYFNINNKQINKMNQEQAISILLQLARVAQSKGILQLEEAVVVAQAVSTLTPKTEDLATEVAQEAEVVKTKGKK